MSSMAKLNGKTINTLAKINGMDITGTGAEENLAIGTILFYRGVGIADAGTRDEMIGSAVGDTVTLTGWYVANGEFAGTPDFIDQFIRAEATSSDVASGDDDAINVAHTHVLTAVVSHTHTLNSTGAHYHTVPSSGSLYVGGISSMQNASGYYWGYSTWYVDSDGLHDHTIGSSYANHSHTVTGSGGASGVDKNIPAYYSVIVIIKMS